MFKDLEAQAKTIAPIIKKFVSDAINPLIKRVEALENIEPVKGEPGEPGPKGEPGEPGKPGEPGEPGKSVDEQHIKNLIESQINSWCLDFERRATDILLNAVGNIPAPKDGEPGRDALPVENIDMRIHGRQLMIGFETENGVIEKGVTLNLPEYRGVYDEKETYNKGDFVTHAGSVWHCNSETTAKQRPGTNNNWQLAVKKGRDMRSGGGNC